MKRKYKYSILLLLSVIVIFIIIKFFSFLLSVKLQNEIPQIYENKFAKKEAKNHIFSVIYENRYPVSFYRVPDKYDFVIYSFDGLTNDILDIKFEQSSNTLQSDKYKVFEKTDFTEANVYYYKNQDEKIAKVRFNGASVKSEVKNNMHFFKTEGNYEIFFNNKRAFLVTTNLTNYVFIKNEGDFYQICILEIYNEADKENIISRFSSY